MHCKVVMGVTEEFGAAVGEDRHILPRLGGTDHWCHPRTVVATRDWVVPRHWVWMTWR